MGQGERRKRGREDTSVMNAKNVDSKKRNDYHYIIKEFNISRCVVNSDW